MTGPTIENDAHAGCQEAWEKQRRRSDFTEARLSALVVGFRQLAQAMDRCDGHDVYAELGGKTLGGSIRWLLRDLEDARPVPPEGTQP